MTPQEMDLVTRVLNWLGPAGLIGALILAGRLYKAMDARITKAIAAHAETCASELREAESKLREELRSSKGGCEETRKSMETAWRKIDQHRADLEEHRLYAARTYITQEQYVRLEAALARDAESIRESIARLAERPRR